MMSADKANYWFASFLLRAENNDVTEAAAWTLGQFCVLASSEMQVVFPKFRIFCCCAWTENSGDMVRNFYLVILCGQSWRGLLEYRSLRSRNNSRSRQINFTKQTIRKTNNFAFRGL